MATSIFLDIETYHNGKEGYDLRKLSLVEYVRDRRFKIHGLGAAIDSGAPFWVTEKDIPRFFDQAVPDDCTLVGHNAKFDFSALAQVADSLQHVSGFVDTKGLARAVLGKLVEDYRLSTLARWFGLAEKGELKTDGIRELDEAQETELAAYCLHDVELCRSIYENLADAFPACQLPHLDWTIRSFVYPQLRVNTEILDEAVKEEERRKAAVFEKIGIPKAAFSSNIQFAGLLSDVLPGIPSKRSSRTGKTIPALAMGDTGFLDLLESSDSRVRELCEARKEAKSTLLETRAAKLAGVGRSGPWPFDVEFSGAAQTHRYSGGGGAAGNPQNFTRDSVLREAITAPPGHVLVVGDFCVAKSTKILMADMSWRNADTISAGEEIVGFDEELPCRFLRRSTVLGSHLVKKRCRRIETSRGEVVCSEDHMWVVKRPKSSGGFTRQWIRTIDLRDGDKIVFLKEPWEEDTSRDGAWLSGFMDGEGWASGQKVGFGQNDGHVLEEARRILTERGFRFSCRKSPNARCNQVTITGDKEGLRLLGTLRPKRLLPKAPLLWEGRRTWHPRTGDYAEVRRLSFAGVMDVVSMQTTTKTFVANGFLSHNCQVEMRLVAYLANDLALIEAIEGGKDVYCEFASVYFGRRITKADKAERWFGKTAILGLGYSMGPDRFAHTVRVQTGQVISDKDARRAVSLYRSRYYRVPQLWSFLDHAIPRLARGEIVALGSLPAGLEDGCVVLPSGLKLRFPGLKQKGIGRHGRPEWTYEVWGKKGQKEETKLYGGKLLENITQALAGELAKESNLEFVQTKTLVGVVHDETILSVPRQDSAAYCAKLTARMEQSPAWLPKLRLKAEVGIGHSWREAKANA